MKVVLVYLDVLNNGDRIIYDTARWLSEQCLKELQISADIVPLDIGSYRPRAPRSRLSKVKKLYYKLADRKAEDMRERGNSQDPPAPDAYRSQWKKSFHYHYYQKHERSKLEGADLIIFCGGGLIKFHRQDFHYFIDDITEYAQQHHIPVILNAVGIEGYAAGNPECMILKEAVNRSCVTSITTRDDIEMLNRDYMTNPAIRTALVCDPAFWIKETYHIGRDEAGSADRIGLNLIRPEIFGEYVTEISREVLGSLYYDMIRKLLDQGRKVTLFSNGAEADDRFGRWLLERYPDLKGSGIDMVCPKDPESFIRCISGFERIIAARLHTSIIATVLGIPNVSLVWNRKQPLFGEQVGLPENYIPMTKFDAEYIVQKLNDARGYEMDPEYKESVRRTLLEAIRQAAGKTIWQN